MLQAAPDALSDSYFNAEQDVTRADLPEDIDGPPSLEFEDDEP